MTATFDTRHLSPLLVQSSGVHAVRGEGMWVFADDGRRYLDFTAGIGVTSTGHCHPTVVAAVQEQAGRLLHGQYTMLVHEGLLRLASRLAGLAPDGLDSVCFYSAGTEAVETSIRLARHATGRPNVIAFQGGFHGRTMGSASVTSSSTKLRAGLQPMMGGVAVAPFPQHYRLGWTPDEATRFCLAELDQLLVTVTAPDETAAMIVEPVQGEGGFFPATEGFLGGLVERCRAHGILLIVDEVQSGYGRTGRFWGHEHDGIRPDVVVTAKGLASGLPLSAVIASRELMGRGRPGSQGGTYGGNAVACAAALATLDVFESEQLVDNARERGTRLRAGLERLQREHPRIGDVRGRGLMLGTEMVTPDGRPDGALAGRLLAEAEPRGLLLLRCGPFGQVVRFLPALVVRDEHIDEALDAFGGALAAAE